MSSDDGLIWIVFNGEIYNFQETRKDLVKKGYRFKSNTDTEVIIYLYKEYGEKCLGYLRGMFAFAIWDSKKEQLFIARDRIGKKPVFYYYDQKTFIFGSEIKSITEDPIVKKDINYEAVCDYFKYLYVPDPKTIFNNINKLKPGHYLTCDKSGVTTREYWDVSFSQNDHKGIDEIKSELIEILDESVNLRMISDVPLGAFLSGGIDSSLVVALMAQHKADPVTTCSIGFDSEVYDEIRFAGIIADKFKTDHHEFTVKQNAAEILQKLVYHFDEPFADSSSIPTYYVSKLARQKVTVALSGDGGDENFAGYEKYYIDDIENRFRNRIPGPIRRHLFPALVKLLINGNHKVFRKGVTLLDTLGHDADYGFYLTNSEFNDHIWNKVINDDTRRKIAGYDPSQLTRAYYHKADTDDHLSKILYTDLKTYLAGDILVKVDRMSMANSLEVRAPILDHNVIEFAAGLSPDIKYNQGEKKIILKQAFQEMLPSEILYRKKMGFSVPMADWLRGELREIAETKLFSNNAGISNFFQMNRIRRLWQQHQTHTRDHGTILWSLLMFELWCREFIP